jgi:hypothetical protein
MSFQYVIDYAESISINRLKVVASTTSRDGTVRSVSRGGQVWRFDVKLPDGMRWSDEWRSKISQLEALDRTTTGTFQLNTTGMEWFSKYQGNSVNSTGFVATIVQGSTSITLTTSPTTSSGFKFKAGDLIQLGSAGKCYTVAADVGSSSTTVTLHRPCLDASANSVALRVGPNCVFSVVCTEFPQWNLFARDQVSWSGSFVFSEALV